MHFGMNIMTVYTLNSHLSTLKADITKNRMLLSSAEIFEVSLTNNVDPDQAAPASILMLTNKNIFGCSYFADVLRVKSYVLCLY